MLIRALIVFLLMLNVGVAAWWLTRPAPPAAAPVASTPDVPRLRLADEQQTGAEARFGSDDIAATPAASPVSPDHCVSYGPFASADAAAQAGQRMQSQVARVRIRAQAAGPYRGWKVWLPPYASLEEVEAVSARVAAAGFSDFFVMREGRDANSLALGRFADEAPAQQHAAALVAAGFPARAEPIGTGPVSHWLDVAASADAAAHLRRLAAAPEARDLDCATLR